MLRKSLMTSLGLLLPMCSLAAVELEIVRSVRVSFHTASGKQYQIHTSASPDSGDWIPLGDPVEGTGEVYSFSQDFDQPDKSFFKVEEIAPELEEFTIAGLEMIMVPISAGTFVMGSLNDGDQIGNSYGPPTTVTISRHFWMSQFEVAQGQYGELMGNNPSRFKSAGLNAPVEQVSWKEAVEYCQKLTERERATGRLPSGHEYRLPTEAQWEYACRAGTTTRFFFGEDPDFSELDQYAWYRDNSGSATHPVGEKLPNPWGLYDIKGNVGEWCSDWIGDYPGGEVVDPAGNSGPSFFGGRALRGCSWRSSADCSRSFTRGGFLGAIDSIGFRPVLVSVDYPTSPD